MLYSYLFPALGCSVLLRAVRWLTVLAVLGGGGVSWAGGGPENCLLVVNPDSPRSMVIANHYIALRHIPACNVMYLSWDPKAETTDVDTFRRRILLPVVAAAGVLHPGRRIDCVVYSADFPWGIDLASDVRKFRAGRAEPAAAGGDAAEAAAKPGGAGGDAPDAERPWPKFLTPTGSLTGLTFLWEPVLRGSFGYFERRSNWYARPGTAGPGPAAATRAFSGSVFFGPRGEVVPSGAISFGPRGEVVPSGAVSFGSHSEIASPGAESLGTHGDATPSGAASSGAHGDVTPSGAASLGPQGHAAASGGRRYLLSMMLGVTSGRGNSLDEVLHYLRVSAGADGTHPRGTIYFVENGDVRSRVRHDEYPAAVRQLKALGVEAGIEQGIMPLGKDDVQGAMMGTATLDWQSSGSTIRPGAICEHFTSLGGEMHAGAGQTPLSELLRFGAAAASGAVTEPYAIAEKFPSAEMQVHYARGATVAEAFYLSVCCPYQLLIVGDPLCRPWANIPAVTVAGIEPGAAAAGMLHLKPAAQLAGSAAVEYFELFIDGLLMRHCPPGGSLDLDTRTLSDGHHELRIVAVEAGPIRSQGRLLLPITTANYQRSIRVSVEPRGVVAADRPLVISARAPGCIGICVVEGTRLLGKIVGEEGRLEIRPARLGAGPVRLQVIGLGANGSTGNVLAAPIDLEVRGEHGK